MHVFFFTSLGHVLRSGTDDYYGNYTQPFEELPNYFTKWL